MENKLNNENKINLESFLTEKQKEIFKDFPNFHSIFDKCAGLIIQNNEKFKEFENDLKKIVNLILTNSKLVNYFNFENKENVKLFLYACFLEKLMNKTGKNIFKNEDLTNKIILDQVFFKEKQISKKTINFF